VKREGRKEAGVSTNSETGKGGEGTGLSY